MARILPIHKPGRISSILHLQHYKQSIIHVCISKHGYTRFPIPMICNLCHHQFHNNLRAKMTSRQTENSEWHSTSAVPLIFSL